MKPISPRAHGYLDYATVLAFLFAPWLFDFGGLPAGLAWILAAVHLAVTLVTDFPLGLVPWLPFSIHGLIERAVGPLLILAPFILGFAGNGLALQFYLAIGIGIVAVSWLTDYGASKTAP